MCLYIILTLFLSSSIHGKKLHEHLTKDEIRSIFNVHHDDVHKLDYEVADILHIDPNNRLHTRKTRSADPELHLTAFNQDYKLYLEENNNVLWGDKTPIIIAETNSTNSSDVHIVYDQITYSSLKSFKLYHDVENKAAVSLEYEDDNRFHVNGVIGTDIAIRSLPKRVHDDILSENSTDSGGISTPHVLIKRNTFENLHPNGLHNETIDVNSDTETKSPEDSSSSVSTSKDTVYPELLITMDYETYTAHNSNVEETAKYMAAFWNAVDLRFREMTNPKVRLNIAGLIIPMQRNAAIYMTRHMVAPLAIHDINTLKQLGKYFSKYSSQFSHDTYDVVVSITHNKIGSIEKNGNLSFTTMGISVFKGVCKLEEGQSAVIIRDVGGFKGITTAAHELAHSFSALHDGNETNNDAGGPCPWQDGYLMSYNRRDEKGFHFSNCSIRAMQEFFTLPQTQCLRNKPDVGHPFTKILPGRLQSRDQQCRIVMGHEWKSHKKNEKNCALLWCAKSKSKWVQIASHTNRPPAEGTPCGNGTICLNANCVNDPELS